MIPFSLLLMIAWVWGGLPRITPTAASEPDKPVERRVSSSTADHSQFEALQKEFQTGPEVTKACLSCHTEAAAQLQETIHWTWECDDCQTNNPVGKKHVINNFCIGLASNEPRCTSCHIGYGWEDKTFDFTAEENIDCLICHDTTGNYKKFPTAAGHPAYEPTDFSGKTWEPPDLTQAAQSVGPPTRQNCGTCHFFGGGGAGVKHGSLDPSLFHPDHTTDVHMAEDGPNFECVDCHKAPAHDIQGSRIRMSIGSDNFQLPLPLEENRASCVACHSEAPMQSAKLNDHTDKVACQSCHIPQLARGNLPTKLYWDWTTAGRMDETGKPYTETDENGVTIYDTKKGSFVWDKNVEPEYVWSNGIIRYVMADNKIDDSQPVALSIMEGSYHDPFSRIFPVKVHRGKQPYDPQNKTMVIPHLFGKDEAAYWKSYDWDKAIAAGMEYAGYPYSGEYDFVETEMHWPATHMVAPVEEAVDCAECHTRQDGRLAALSGFYLVGRDRNVALDTIGWILVGGAFLGVVGHGGLRITGARRNKKKEQKND